MDIIGHAQEIFTIIIILILYYDIILSSFSSSEFYELVCSLLICAASSNGSYLCGSVDHMHQSEHTTVSISANLNVQSLFLSCTVCTPPPLLILSLIICIVCVHVGYPHQLVWFENVFSPFHLFSLHKCSVDPVYVIASYTFNTVYHTIRYST